MDWGPPYLCPSGTCLGSRREGLLQPHNAQRELGHTGAATLRLGRACDNSAKSSVGESSARAALVGDRHLLGDGPDKGRHFPRDRDDHLMNVFAAGHQASVALAESDLGLPADILERLGHFFQPQLQGATHLGRIAIGPRALDEDPAGLGVAGLRDRSLASPFPHWSVRWGRAPGNS